MKVAALQLFSCFQEQKDIEWSFILNCGEWNVILVAVWIFVVQIIAGLLSLKWNSA